MQRKRKFCILLEKVKQETFYHCSWFHLNWLTINLWTVPDNPSYGILLLWSFLMEWSLLFPPRQIHTRSVCQWLLHAPSDNLSIPLCTCWPFGQMAIQCLWSVKGFTPVQSWISITGVCKCLWCPNQNPSVRIFTYYLGHFLYEMTISTSWKTIVMMINYTGKAVFFPLAPKVTSLLCPMVRWMLDANNNATLFLATWGAI